MTADEQADLSRLAGRQLDLGRQFDKLLERMEQVAKQIKETDPFSSESISDALHAGRKQSLSGLMRDGGEAVGGNRIGQALTQQAAVSRGLDEMVDILSNRREQELSRLVQKLRESERELDTLRRDQAGLRKQLKQASGAADAQERREQLQRLARRQRELKEEADRLARQLDRLQADKAAEAMTQAGGAMDQAASNSEQEKADLADEQTAHADQDLDEAQRRLAAARRKAEADLAQEQMARLEDALISLSDRQRHVNNETMRLDKLRAAQGQFTRGQAQSVQELARAQQTLGDDVAGMAEKLAGATAFQYVLDAAAGEMRRIAERLNERDTSAAVQQQEADVLARLEQLSAALADKGSTKPGGSQQGGDNGGGQQGGQNIRTMAEVRLVRLMQEDLNRRTRRLTELLMQKPAPGDDDRAALAALAKEQSRLAELLLGLTSEGGKEND